MAVGRDFFVASKQRFHVSPVCEAVGAVPNYSDLSDAGQLLGRMAWRAARYALRVSRSVVVSLSLSRRNAASESEERPSFAKACHYTRMGFESKSHSGPPSRTAPTTAAYSRVIFHRLVAMP